MSFLVRFLVFALGLTVGLLILKYLERIVYNLGKSEWAERKFGNGGTYILWQLVAVGLMIGSFVFALLM